MESLAFLFPFLGCALMGLVCFALMHRSGSSTTPPADGEIEGLREEVIRLRAEVADLGAATPAVDESESR